MLCSIDGIQLFDVLKIHTSRSLNFACGYTTLKTLSPFCLVFQNKAASATYNTAYAISQNFLFHYVHNFFNYRTM